jgi:hypothetical protein
VLKKGGQHCRRRVHRLNEYMYWLLEQAAKRAKANGGKTVRAHDRPTRGRPQARTTPRARVEGPLTRGAAPTRRYRVLLSRSNFNPPVNALTH